MILGCARVWTKDQNLDGQHDALKAAGAKLFSQTRSPEPSGPARSWTDC